MLHNLVKTLDDESLKDEVRGEKGHLMVPETSVNSLLVLYYRLCRGLSRDELNRLIGDVQKDIAEIGLEKDRVKAVCDLFTLCFQTRCIRGGKGEKTLCHWFLIELYYNYSPDLVLELLSMLPESFGSWQDINVLGDIVLEDKKEYKDTWYKGPLDIDEVKERIGLVNKFIKHIVRMFITQLGEDEKSDNPSLCSKWAAREGKRYWNVGKIIALTKYTASCKVEQYSSYKNWNKYVKLISNRLNLVEKRMCNGEWADIVPGHVPARCLMKNRDAFLNVDKKSREQRSDDADRIQCQENFTEHLDKCKEGGAKLHGAVLHPHELVKSYIASNCSWENTQVDKQANDIIEVQWRDIIDAHKQTMLDSGKVVENMFIMSDVSGSMYQEDKGTRYIDACIALSLACSELQTGHLRNRCLTFHSKPEWVVFDEGDTLYNRVSKLYQSQWGYNTNLYLGFDKILKHIVECDIDPDTIRDMKFLILSDMQFDAAGSTWDNTVYMELEVMFREAGLRSKWRTPYACPEIIFWNLNGSMDHMVDDGGRRGVKMLSGFSPTAFYDFLGHVTPLESLMQVLESDKYLEVRETIRKHYGLEVDVVDEVVEDKEEEDDYILVD